MLDLPLLQIEMTGCLFPYQLTIISNFVPKAYSPQSFLKALHYSIELPFCHHFASKSIHSKLYLMSYFAILFKLIHQSNFNFLIFLIQHLLQIL